MELILVQETRGSLFRFWFSEVLRALGRAINHLRLPLSPTISQDIPQNTELRAMAVMTVNSGS